MENEFELNIYIKELDQIVNKYGSFISILLNKNISCVSFFSQLLKDDDLRIGLEKISNFTWFELVTYMTYRYPILHKSKKIKHCL